MTTSPYFIMIGRTEDKPFIRICRYAEVDDGGPAPFIYADLDTEDSKMILRAIRHIDCVFKEKFDDPEKWRVKVGQLRKEQKAERFYSTAIPGRGITLDISGLDDNEIKTLRDLLNKTLSDKKNEES